MMRTRNRARGGGSVKWYESGALALNGISPTYVSDFLNARYYSSSVGARAFPYTSVRTGNATHWDSQGRLVWAPANMFLNSATLGTQAVTVLSGAPYTISFYGTGTVTLSVGATGSLVGTGASDRVSLNFTTTGTSVTFTVTGSVTSAQLEPTGVDSPKAYNATTGSAYYGPRLDYNPATRAARGIQVETAINNILTSSFPNVGNVSGVTSTATTSFYGFSCHTATANGASSAHYFYADPATPSASSTNRLEAIVKSNGGETRIQLTGSANWSAANVYANFNIVSGTVLASGAGATNARIDDLGDGWFKVGFNYTAIGSPTSGEGAILAFITGDSDTRLPTNTSTGSVFYTLFQHHTTALHSPSINPTYAAPVNRAADNVSEALGAWFDATQGTIYCNFERGTVQGPGPTEIFMQLDDGTGNERFTFTSGFGTHSQHRFDVIDGGVSQAAIQSSVGGAARTDRKMAGVFQVNNFKAVENGGTVGTDATGTLPTVTTLRIGSGISADRVDGWVKEFRYYPDVSASNAQLQTLTT